MSVRMGTIKLHFIWIALLYRVAMATNIEGKVGSDVVLPCEAKSSYDVVTVRWKFEPTETIILAYFPDIHRLDRLNPDPRFNITNTTHLSISSLRHEDTGGYACILAASNLDEDVVIRTYLNVSDVTCTIPYLPNDLRHTNSSCRPESVVGLNHECIFQCDDGHILVGNSSAWCLRNESMTTIPTCEESKVRKSTPVWAVILTVVIVLLVISIVSFFIWRKRTDSYKGQRHMFCKLFKPSKRDLSGKNDEGTPLNEVQPLYYPRDVKDDYFSILTSQISKITPEDQPRVKLRIINHMKDAEDRILTQQSKGNFADKERKIVDLMWTDDPSSSDAAFAFYVWVWLKSFHNEDAEDQAVAHILTIAASQGKEETFSVWSFMAQKNSDDINYSMLVNEALQKLLQLEHTSLSDSTGRSAITEVFKTISIWRRRIKALAQGKEIPVSEPSTVRSTLSASIKGDVQKECVSFSQYCIRKILKCEREEDRSNLRLDILKALYSN